MGSCNPFTNLSLSQVVSSNGVSCLLRTGDPLIKPLHSLPSLLPCMAYLTYSLSFLFSVLILHIALHSLSFPLFTFPFTSLSVIFFLIFLSLFLTISTSLYLLFLFFSLSFTVVHCYSALPSSHHRIILSISHRPHPPVPHESAGSELTLDFDRYVSHSPFLSLLLHFLTFASPVTEFNSQYFVYIWSVFFFNTVVILLSFIIRDIIEQQIISLKLVWRVQFLQCAAVLSAANLL